MSTVYNPLKLPEYRKYFKGKYILEKGDTNVNYRRFVIAEID